MQSAFVDIGLERDAFLYVSDFFDEEEEIERIVLAKSKEEKSPEEADKEATDHIERQRLKREKEMEDAQERAEIDERTTEGGDKEDEKKQTRGRGSRSRKKSETQEETVPEEKEEKPKRGRRGSSSKRKEEEKDEPKHENVLEVADIDFGDSDFERIVDEDADTGEMLKDAMMQEAIIDNVRSIEFDMEESSEFAEVGSLLDSVSDFGNGFERVADEEEEEQGQRPQKSSRRRSTSKSTRKTTSRSRKKAEHDEAEEKAEEEKPKKAPRKRKSMTSRSKKADDAEADAKETSDDDKPSRKSSTRSRSSRSRKSTTSKRSTRTKKTDPIPDGEASVSDSEDVSEMAARRGSRGGRRKSESGAGKAPVKSKTHTDKGYKTTDAEQPIVADDAIAQAEFKKPRGRRGGNSGGGRGRSRRSGKGHPKITDLLSQGQEILVQIAKEPIAKKGARITSHIALPGRFLVYMPTIEHLGVSRKIDSSKERGRLRSIISKIVSNEDVPSGGFIVRTAGVGKSESELRDDARYLLNTWYDIRSDAETAKSPAVIHQDLDIILRLLRDHLSDDFNAIRVDSEEEYLRIIEFINRIQPALVKRVKFHTLDEPILDSYGVSEEIDKALKHRVWLKSGGYLVINQTEALIAIDVNTGKFVGKGNARLEDTITKTNLEAVNEIARQIRLRDLGGIIVLDLIDMEDRGNRKKVLQALQEALQADKSPTKVLSFNDFGLIIMTRKRVKQSLERTLCSPCDYCEGAGWIKSAQTICYEVLEEARRISKGLSDVRETTLRVHPEVASALRKEERTILDEIEAYLGPVDLTADKSLHQEKFAFAFV
ncbi:MAG: hypothetical protein DWQ47_00920 [Acidobacteria bacterium]|nr:MAG: hypothetical protein DWQ32_11380 [Acidobacteriota bacterium]REK04218.1 MAG: hypothetical protein DWQ38_00905 [Acidobacteriota bacterium]REK15479.1 MAG: hypothetical protein DWQ43_17070 [Acidobacteriota bacterium]REK46470.1 MAG: hypothetical protein DWQ47_00920 [Acidobacteriota bacterium]